MREAAEQQRLLADAGGPGSASPSQAASIGTRYLENMKEKDLRKLAGSTAKSGTPGSDTASGATGSDKASGKTGSTATSGPTGSDKTSGATGSDGKGNKRKKTNERAKVYNSAYAIGKNESLKAGDDLEAAKKKARDRAREAVEEKFKAIAG